MDLNKKRCGAIKRTTAETAIDIKLNLDGTGKSNIKQLKSAFLTIC